VAILAHKQEPLLGAVLLTGIPAYGARLARIVRVHFDDLRACQEGLIGEEAVQFGERPRRGVPVGSSLLLARLFALLPLGALANVGQVFQADEAVWVAVHDAPTEHMVANLLQPSLPPGDHDQSPCGRTGAFVLQPLSQSRVMIGFGPHLFPAIEGGAVIQTCHHRQIALPYVYTDDPLVRFGCGVGHLHFQGNQQIEPLLGFIVPEFGRADLGPVLEERHVLVEPLVRQDDAPTERQDADLLASLQTVVPVVIVGQRRGDVVGCLVQPFVALLGESRLALLRVLSGLGPQALVGGPHLAGDVAGHLSGEPKPHANFIVALTLQPLLVALLAVCKRVARDVVQRVPVGETGLPERLELLGRGMQFQFGGQGLLHRTSVLQFTGNIKDSHPSRRLKADGTPARYVKCENIPRRVWLWKFAG
jgi:hypothetical protein